MPSRARGGQPNAPFTGSLGLEYRFNAYGKDSYVRLDYEHSGARKMAFRIARQYSAARHLAVSAKPLTRCRRTNFMTLRGGVTWVTGRSRLSSTT